MLQVKRQRRFGMSRCQRRSIVNAHLDAYYTGVLYTFFINLRFLKAQITIIIENAYSNEQVQMQV